MAVIIASLFSAKAKKRVRGYKNADNLKHFQEKKLKRVWFHCASLGEFEQGRPLIEKYQNDSGWEVIVSFFSPSGYEIVKKKALVDQQFYLLPDTKSNAKKTLDLVQPDLVIFIKYEFWANHVFEISKRNIPLYCVSGLFRENQVYFKYPFFAKVLKSFNFFFLQNDKSQELLSTIQIQNCLVTGDTRFDRVSEGAKKAVSVNQVEVFLNGEKALIIGSSWPDDEQQLYSLLLSDKFKQKTIIAPHEIGEKHILELLKNLGERALRFSDFDSSFKGQQFLIIDNIGMLSNLYQYGNLAYVGGAFHGSLHNILEPAAFGLPVIFGPKFSKFPEGDRFIKEGIGISVNNAEELQNAYQKMSQSLDELNQKVLAFVSKNIGATELIYKRISEEVKDQQ
ncbi:MAG: 3-deoxy-D-manno-octulosonic acid transferase [Crocinitomicaceae bacterium]|nr:3-deoxy-D-manno-octulosonic acid transferase [Crocinitomicaceae bacterium]